MKVAVLGLILLGAAAVLTAAVVTSNTGAVETDLWGATVSDVSIGIVFVAGMLTTVVAVAGLALVMASMRRSQRLRSERRTLRQENERLSEQVRTTTPETGDGATPTPRNRGLGLGRNRDLDRGTEPRRIEEPRRVERTRVERTETDGTHTPQRASWLSRVRRPHEERVEDTEVTRVDNARPGDGGTGTVVTERRRTDSGPTTSEAPRS